MEVEYTFTIEDLQAFHTYQRGGKLAFQPKARRSEWIWFVLLGVMVGAFILFPSQLGRVINTQTTRGKGPLIAFVAVKLWSCSKIDIVISR